MRHLTKARTEMRKQENKRLKISKNINQQQLKTNKTEGSL